LLDDKAQQRLSILVKLTIYWTRHPELRLGQVLDIAAQANDIDAIFDMPDDVLLKWLDCNTIKPLEVN
jgi:uncharacterized protein YihD (DUF1040 family)